MTDQIDYEAPSFDEFPLPTYEDWYNTTIASLKGAPFDKKLTTLTYEGLTLQPIYRADDTAGIAHQHTIPGAYPYVRGTSAAGYLKSPWLIAQELPYPTPELFNEALRYDLQRGQTAVNMLLDLPTRAGLDPDQSRAGQVGYGGVSIASPDDLTKALDGVDLATTPLFIRVGASGLPVMALLLAVLRKQGRTSEALQGCIEADPLGELATTGTLPLSLERSYDQMAALTSWAAAHAPKLQTIAVHTDTYLNAGGSAVQELAYGLATGVAYLRAMNERGLDINTVAPRIRFMFGIGGDLFMEIAKLRAARLLWAQAVRAFGGDEPAQQMSTHARTGTYNKSVHDPYVNMLRTTVEAFAGAVGGADSMHVAPFDETVRLPDEFSRRIARNQQIILQEEVNLTRLIDPAGGSWYIEMLTDWLGREAWAHFQQTEADGGMVAALQNGTPQQAIAQVAAQRADNLATRKNRLIGTNIVPDLHETPLEADTTDYDAIYQQRAEAIAYLRTHDDDAVLHISALDKLGHLLNAAPDKLVAAAIEAAADGATLGEIARTLRGDDTNMPQIEPVHIHRAAQMFEALRHNAATYATQNGHAPQIFMANMGPLVQHKARADFTRGFYEVGGFDLIDAGGFDTPQQATDAALKSGAGAVVICSTDATYPVLVPPLISAIKQAQPDTVVILAGYPTEHIDDFRAAGIDDFIHLKANCYQMNVDLQQRLGVWQDAHESEAK